MKNNQSQQGKRYPMSLILSVAEYSSAAWYGRKSKSEKTRKPGPSPLVSDGVLLELVKYEVANGYFHSEGYKKVDARLKSKKVVASKRRVLSLMQDHSLLTPNRPKSNGSSRKHDGTIITKIPNKMWGTDGKYFYTAQEGRCCLFSVIDHCTDEILGHCIVKKADRFAAIEAVREAVRNEFGDVKKGTCEGVGLFVRADHGSQYSSADFKKEMKFLRIEESPAFVRSPECNGIIERFHRTLEDELLSFTQFETLEDAKILIEEFIGRYNNHWIIERHGYLSPIEYKKKLKKISLKSA